MRTALAQALEPALARREALVARLHSEGTDCYRLLHGIAEGIPGVTVDRYGPVVLVQTWREPLERESVEDAARIVGAWLGEPLEPAWRHRGTSAAAPDASGRPRRRPPAGESASCRADRHRSGSGSVEGRELGVRYDVRPHHDGRDPLLFLDLRSVRRRVLATARANAVLNLFAYTCGVGVCAALGGAPEVLNVDFGRRALEVGRSNARRNGVPDASFRTLRADVFPVLRQLAGLPVKGRAARSHRYPIVASRTFDLVVLDPPRWSTSPFGAVDTVRDYESLFKPAALATRPGGTIIATNHVPSVPLEAWLARLERCARKAGRPIARMEILTPEEDFPSFDGRPPLKTACVELAE